MKQHLEEEQKTEKKNASLKIGALLFAAAVLVSIGYGLGKGTLTYGRLKNQVSQTQQSNLDIDSIEEVYNALKREYDGELDNKKLQDGIKQGLATASGDPYTEYFNAEDAKDFTGELQGEFTGIGAELSKEEERIVIISPIAGFPAEKAGLLPKDIIVEIDGQSAYNLTISEAVKKIRGPKDTKVKLGIVRDEKEALSFEITRDTIKVPSVQWSIKDNNVGYLKITRFADDTVGLSRKAAAEFTEKNVKGIIVDVRSNPGGELGSSVDIASLWLKPGQPVLFEKRGGKVIKTYSAKGGNSLTDIPTIVLINEGSASASEILAGALADSNAATLVGMTSFGKGSVQQLVPLSGESILKVTIARWYTPKDRNIDKEGIEPKVIIDRTSDDFKNNRDPQLDKALELLK